MWSFTKYCRQKNQWLTFEWGSKNFGIFRNCCVWAAWGAVPDLGKEKISFCFESCWFYMGYMVAVWSKYIFYKEAEIVGVLSANCQLLRHFAKAVALLSQNSSDTPFPEGLSLSHTNKRNTETETKELSERKTFSSTECPTIPRQQRKSSFLLQVWAMTECVEEEASYSMGSRCKKHWGLKR